MIEGSENAVKEVIEWARRGPDLARVDAVDVSDAVESFLEFSIDDTV